MKASLKSLVQGQTQQPPQAGSQTSPSPEAQIKGYRTAQTRTDTRQVSGHFKSEVSQTLRLIAVEQNAGVLLGNPAKIQGSLQRAKIKAATPKRNKYKIRISSSDISSVICLPRGVNNHQLCAVSSQIA